MDYIVSELIDKYIQKNRQELVTQSDHNTLHNIMKISEVSFMEWDNEEDEVYNEL